MKYAFLTGAAGGICGAIVDELERRGDWTIFAADVKPVEKTSDRIIPITIDVRSQESCNEAAAKVAEYTDHLDVVGNIAGVHTMASLVEGDPAPILEWMIDINVLGMARVNKAFFPLVQKGHGRIVNFSSECGWEKPQPFNSPYAITKYAVEAYTIGLRRELSFLGIPVIKIQPGSFKTGMHGAANAGYEKLYNSTTHYKDVLAVMKPLMSVAMAHPHEMEDLVKVVVHAMETPNPRTNYRVKNTWYLELIDPIPDKIIDTSYNVFIKVGVKVLKLLGKY